jgi:hypothetical protein
VTDNSFSVGKFTYSGIWSQGEVGCPYPRLGGGGWVNKGKIDLVYGGDKAKIDLTYGGSNNRHMN